MRVPRDDQSGTDRYAEGWLDRETQCGPTIVVEVSTWTLISRPGCRNGATVKSNEDWSKGMNMRTRCLIISLLMIPVTGQADEVKPDDQQILSWLAELEPLPKVHYSWPVPLGKVPPELLYEYVRLTHAVSLSGEWSSQEQVDQAVAVCQRVNSTNPETPASIGINYSIWHRRFGKELPPTDTGATHRAELDYLKSRLTFLRMALETSNRKRSASVAISAVLFDSEHFHIRPDDEAWNTAITKKYDAAYDIVREFFPAARIEWYARGAIHPAASPTGWSEAKYFALDEKGESFGCSLYQVPEIGYTREIFRRTAANADRHKCHEVTPWIALASGYRRQVDKYHEFSLDWNYDLIYSWQLGAEINHAWFGAAERSERFAPWHRAKIAIFYPEPFGRTPYWPQHFVAYVRGAHLIRKLPEPADSRINSETDSSE